MGAINLYLEIVLRCVCIYLRDIKVVQYLLEFRVIKFKFVGATTVKNKMLCVNKKIIVKHVCLKLGPIIRAASNLKKRKTF